MVTAFVAGTVYAWYKQNVLDALYGWLGGFALSIIVLFPSCVAPEQSPLNAVH